MWSHEWGLTHSIMVTVPRRVTGYQPFRRFTCLVENRGKRAFDGSVALATRGKLQQARQRGAREFARRRMTA